MTMIRLLEFDIALYELVMTCATLVYDSIEMHVGSKPFSRSIEFGLMHAHKLNHKQNESRVHM